MKLPIDAIEADVRSALSQTNRLVVTAETGAGKSTRVPVWMADEMSGRVLVVEPRRVACQALAGFLASEQGERVGGFFGSRVRFGDASSDDTQVLFATPGIAVKMLAADTPWFDAVVVDEFHERSCEMDLIVAVLASNRRFRDVPLVVTSATLDATEVGEALGAQTFHTEGRTFPVSLSYRGDNTSPSGDGLDSRVAEAVDHAINNLEGDVLVFLPGMSEIRSAQSALRLPGSIDVEIVHGSRPPEQLQRVLRASSRRTVFLSTNVAETSVTIPGVRVVIDSGLAKTKVHRAGRSALATVAIAQDSMDQRMGRAGRVADGWCIRLWSERFRPSPYSPPEIERVELDDLILDAANCGLVGRRFDRAKWVTEPPEFAVERARERLRSLGAWDGDELSEKGKALAELPMSADEAALLVDPPDAIAGTLCDLVAILQARGSLLLSLNEVRGNVGAIKDARAELLEGVTNEVDEALTVLRRGNSSHGVSGRRLDETRKITRQLRDILGVGRDQGNSTRGLAEHILRRLPETGFVLRPRASDAKSSRRRGRGRPWANGEIEVNVRPYQPADPFTDAKDPDAAVILETFWLSSGTHVFGLGRMVLPTTRSVLAEAGIGEVVIGKLNLKKGRAPRVTAHRKTELASVTLQDEEVPLRGRELCEAVAELVMKRRLFKGAAEPIRDALFGWKLIAEWPEPAELGAEPKSAPDATPVEWLAERLEELGVRTNQDLQLIENEDLIPDLADATGVARFAFEPILAEFPRVWEHQGARYSVEVAPSRKLVTLEPANKSAKNRAEPDRKFVPRFRGFGVRYRQASRIVRIR